jgi:hypothetical protein
LPAIPIFDNGTPDNLDGHALTDFLQADNFTVGSPSNLVSIRFWNLEASPADYSGSIFWAIYSNNAGVPGSQLFSGSAAPTRTAAGTALGFNQFQNDFNISVNNILAGVYWLVLHNGDPATNTTFTDYYWATSAAGVGDGQQKSLSPPDIAWSTNSSEHAFAIFGDAAGAVPEPGALGLVVVGLGLLLARKHFS